MLLYNEMKMAITRIIPLLFLFFVAFEVQSTLATANEEYNFKILNDKTLPEAAESFATHTVQSFIFCVSLCSRNQECLSIYANKTGHNNSLSCSLLSQRIAQEQLSDGDGAYAYVDTVKTSDAPIVISHSDYLYTARYRGNLVAVYDFGLFPKWTTLGVMYDHEENRWPNLESYCMQTLYQRQGLSATVVKIIYVGHQQYRFEPQCRPGESYFGYDTCDADGQFWAASGVTSVSCISPVCYRNDAVNHARYNGNVSWSMYDDQCDPWINHASYSSEFHEDDHDKSAAQNYCRDPDGTAVPWCYHSNSLSYDYCEIPKCEWTPYD